MMKPIYFIIGLAVLAAGGAAWFFLRRKNAAQMTHAGAPGQTLAEAAVLQSMGVPTKPIPATMAAPPAPMFAPQAPRPMPPQAAPVAAPKAKKKSKTKSILGMGKKVLGNKLVKGAIVTGATAYGGPVGGMAAGAAMRKV